MKTQDAVKRSVTSLRREPSPTRCGLLMQAASILRNTTLRQRYGTDMVQRPTHRAHCAGDVLYAAGWWKGIDVFAKLAALTNGEACPRCGWVDRAVEKGQPLNCLVVHLNDAHKATFSEVAQVLEKMAATGIEGDKYTYVD